MNVLCKAWLSKTCKQIFTQKNHLKEIRCTKGKTKVICLGSKFKHSLNSSERVLFGSYTKCSFAAFQQIETEILQIDKHVYNKKCGHSGECGV